MPRPHMLILGEHEADFLDQLDGEGDELGDELPDDEWEEEEAHGGGDA